MPQKNMSLRQRKRRTASTAPRKIDPHGSRVLSSIPRVEPEVNSRYSLSVSGTVDREAWAEVTQEILDAECKGNKSAFARRVFIDGKPINPRTVYAWLNHEFEVKESSVHAVAKGFDRNPIELLIRVGFYTLDQVPMRLPDEVVDDEQRYVLDLEGVSDETKVIILQELETWRATDEGMLTRQRERDRERRLALLRERIEYFRSRN